jgi:hypothetical protein
MRPNQQDCKEKCGSSSRRWRTFSALCVLLQRVRKMQGMEVCLPSPAYARRITNGQTGDSPDNVDQIFDALLDCPSVDSRLRTMASSTLLHVAAYGRSYYEREASNGYLEVEAELQVSTTTPERTNGIQVACPPRQVRDFRIARVNDARGGDRPVCRVGMLTVWDAKALGEGALVEGKRYMVSTGHWAFSDVYETGSLMRTGGQYHAWPFGGLATAAP